MAFKTQSSTTGVDEKNRDLVKERAELKNDLSHLGKEFERLSFNISQLKEKESAFKDKSKELKALKEEVADKENNLADLNDKLKETQRELESCESQLASFKEKMTDEGKAELDRFSSLKLHYQEELGKLEVAIKSKQAELEVIQPRLLQADEAVAELNKKLDTLKFSFIKLTGEYEGLIIKYQEVSGNVQSANDEVKRAQESLVRVVNEYNETVKMTEKKKLELERFTNDLASKQDAFDVRCKLKVQELEEREGLISDRSAWLDEKEKNLRLIKTELEKFHGKRIPVNI